MLLGRGSTCEEGEQYSLAWTRTLHFLQDTSMLVPSSSR